MKTSSNSSSPKTCFISAPAGTKLRALRSSLESRGFRVLVPHELEVGIDWASEIQKQLLQADLVIGVITAKPESAWVLFELGQASALGRRILVIASPKAKPIPFPLHQLLVLRIDLDNQDAIEFALDQVVSAPVQQPRSDYFSSRKPLTGLGKRADQLIERLDRSLTSNDRQTLEEVVADALEFSGTDVVATSDSPKLGADYAVWSDVLEPFVGNPFLVEVKAKIRDKTDAQRALQQLRTYVSTSGARWALLLYGEGPAPEDKTWSVIPPNVLVLPLRSLLESLRVKAFPEIIRDLRNRRVHGSSY